MQSCHQLATRSLLQIPENPPLSVASGRAGVSADAGWCARPAAPPPVLELDWIRCDGFSLSTSCQVEPAVAHHSWLTPGQVSGAVRE